MNISRRTYSKALVVALVATTFFMSMSMPARQAFSQMPQLLKES